MKYYTIQNNNILIAENEQALTRFYDNVFELPADYVEGKYIIGEEEIEIDIPDYETVEEEYQEPIYDAEGVQIFDIKEQEAPLFDEDGNPTGETQIQEVQVPRYETKVRAVEKQVGSHKETVTVKGLVLNPNYEQEQADRRETEFNKAFFKTSLGYIRRSVTMQDGSKKDFLSDLLPVISMGVQTGQAVNILTYDKPTFDKDVTDWTQYQHQEAVTPQFIQECFLRLSADFAPSNND